MTRHFASYTEARTNLRTILDTARTGRITTLARDHDVFTVVSAGLLRCELARLRPSHAVVVAEGGGWAALVPGVPVAGDAATLDGAVDDLIDALREYADDWDERLVDAPNHRDNWSLVELIVLSTDEQLREWILVGEAPTATSR